MDESQGPDGRRPLASNSAAATRRQAQIDDIAAGTPRLVKNSGSWFVARKNLPSYKNRCGQIS